MKIKYSEDSSIKTIDEVKDFFKYLVDELKVSFHPDESFSYVVDYQTGRPTFTPEDAETLDNLMDDCFSVCDTYGQDIYELAYEILNSRVEPLKNGMESESLKTEEKDDEENDEEKVEESEEPGNEEFYVRVDANLLKEIEKVVYELGTTPDADFSEESCKPYMEKIVAALKAGDTEQIFV